MADIPISDVDGDGGTWSLTGSDGAIISNGAIETITPPSNSRVVIDLMYSLVSGGSDRWSLTVGGDVVFADTDIILDDTGPTLYLGGRYSIGLSLAANERARFPVDSVVVINNIATGNDIYAAWHYEELK